MRNRIAVVVAALLLLSACTRTTEITNNAVPAPSPAFSPTVGKTPAASPAVASDAPGTLPSASIQGVTLVAYENRAKGYTLQRPDRWYWEHLIKSQLPDGDVTDLFRTDPKPLPGIPGETYGMIAIEVTARSMTDIPAYLQGSAPIRVTIAGTDAMRYEGSLADGAVRVIEYRLARQNETYRFIFTGAAPDERGLKIFAQVVESFKFTTE